MPVMTINKVRHYYRLEGNEDKPVLVLSHSIGLDHSMWDQQIDAFSKHFRVLRHDLRGHGGSGTTGSMSIAQSGRDVLDLLDALHVDRFAFCGLSIGGMIGLWLGAHAGERLTGLVACNAFTRFSAPPGGWEARFGLIREKGMPVFAASMIERFFSEPYRATMPPILGTLRTVAAQTDAEAYIASCLALEEADLSSAPAAIRAPTLVIASPNDAVKATAMVGEISAARLVFLDAGHVPAVEAAGEFNRVVLDFFNEQVSLLSSGLAGSV